VRTQEIIEDFWVGEADYLIRKTQQVIQPCAETPSCGLKKSVSISKFYAFNEDILSSYAAARRERGASRRVEKRTGHHRRPW
jgi:hypothetical protein